MNPAVFVEHFRATFPGLLGQRVLVALSGGPDSVALLHLLREPELGLRLEAAHVHHGTRGREADEDAAFCARLCRDLDVPCHLVNLPASVSLEPGREAAWREARYRLLRELARERELAAVATAHHSDDVAEGVVVQLLRGGGPRALAGIAAATAEGVIRPLLPWSRAAIEGWLVERGIGWREDSSNRDPSHLRNLVRHRLLPQLEGASPGLRGHLVQLAAALARDERWFADELAARGFWIDPWEPEGGVAAAAVSGLEPPLLQRWLHAQAARVGIRRVSRRQGELFEALLFGGEPRAVALGGRWRLRLARATLWLEPPRTPAPLEAALEEGRCLDLGLPGWQIRLAGAGDPPPDLRYSWRVPEGVRLQVRGALPGDRVPARGGWRPARAMLASALPRHLRNAWPVCCENGRILWIPGVWRSPEITARASHVVEVMRRERTSCAV